MYVIRPASASTRNIGAFELDGFIISIYKVNVCRLAKSRASFHVSNDWKYDFLRQ